jgi:putative AdoMet-dependent methyltransferase
MARTEEQTRRLFDEWARSYDTDLLEESGPLIGYARSIGAIDDALPIETNSQVLDIGIGRGAIAERLAEQGARITGIDISKTMLDLCGKQHPNFELHVGTFNHIPLPDEMFNCVVSGFAFHETATPKRGEACREMARVLKPEGYLCLLDIMFVSPLAMQEARQLIAEKWDDDEDYAIVGDLDTLLRKCGFAAVKWRQSAPFHWMVTARKIETKTGVGLDWL